MTQNESLIKYLKTHKSGITTYEAVTRLGICRLSERVRELQSEGRRIGKYRCSVPRRDGSRANLVRYYLAR